MKPDVYETITNQIIAELEKGTVPWAKPWGGALSAHVNAVSAKPYRGINQLLLWVAQANGGYDLPIWLTFKQAQELGGCVRKGEKGTHIVFWKVLEKGEGENIERIPMAKWYVVFNVAQTTVPESAYSCLLPQLRSNPPNDACETFIAACGATITHVGDEAYYSSATDIVNVPALALHADTGAYYSTTFHELTHWTGHESRCNRQLGNRFGSDLYAAEELVAELGSAFLCAKFGLAGKLQHASYLDHWLRVLKSDKRAIFTACSLATKAAEYLASKQPNASPGETPAHDSGEPNELPLAA